MRTKIDPHGRHILLKNGSTNIINGTILICEAELLQKSAIQKKNGLKGDCDTF